jgi:hypothetical protein
MAPGIKQIIFESITPSIPNPKYLQRNNDIGILIIAKNIDR